MVLYFDFLHEYFTVDTNLHIKNHWPDITTISGCCNENFSHDIIYFNLYVVVFTQNCIMPLLIENTIYWYFIMIMHCVHIFNPSLSLGLKFKCVQFYSHDYYMLFSYQTGYIMWHSRLRIYIPWGAAERNIYHMPGMSHYIPCLIAE